MRTGTPQPSHADPNQQIASAQFEAKLPSGLSVLVTRSPDRSAVLVEALREAGAEPLLLPLIDFETVEFSVDALQTGGYDWLVVSSITTVRALKNAAQQRGVPLSSLIPPSTKVATIGPSSRRVLEQEGIEVTLAPQGSQSAAGLVAILPELGGARVWLPQSDIAGSALADGLRAAGAELTVSTAYRTVDYPASNRLVTDLAVGLPEPQVRVLSLSEARIRIDEGRLHAVVAASPSAASRIAQTLAPLGSTAFIAIGQPTAHQALAEGIEVAATAEQPTPQGIVQALQGIYRTGTDRIDTGRTGTGRNSSMTGRNQE
ncbi:uroporphyrinogen-III synthase [Psychromicrobium sp. YIM B11713]|uniref:uroporphyrinogen-III synthase n=1 Tax=Psychromicrobium sp. YIM B11713 TaxID=3145233 RepID=UPI00374E2D68